MRQAPRSESARAAAAREADDAITNTITTITQLKTAESKTQVQRGGAQALIAAIAMQVHSQGAHSEISAITRDSFVCRCFGNVGSFSFGTQGVTLLSSFLNKGSSDHTTSLHTFYGACAWGARSIEAPLIQVRR